MTPTTKQPAIDIDAVSAGPELDALVAEHVMGWIYDPSEAIVIGPRYAEPNGETHYACEAYSTDASRVREVEAEIERRGLTYQYAAWLAKEFDIEVFGFTDKNFNHAAILAEQAYKLITATPEQRCRAAYRAVMGS